MPELVIDGRKVVVPTGTKVIDAAERLGIVIPRFCYHPALGSVGACRVCAVSVLEGPVKGIKMSCRLDAEDGMVISTTDADAVDFRRHVIEWLMMNHPHDCPVCDEGGHCLLQDLTVSGGHGLRRFRGRKRTYRDQYLGPLIQHEMNRCIQCYRCSRFYQEFAGYHDLGVMGVASRIYFGRYRDGTLKSPFAGNLIDLCPTGVYTDRPSRYTGRQWDFGRHPSICIHCSLGCHLTVNTRYRRIVKQEARLEPEINGHFICDRGRYGFFYADQEDRPRTGRVNREKVTGEQAVALTAQRLDAISQRYGPSSVATLVSPRCSLETLAGTLKLCRDKGWRQPYVGLTRRHLGNVHTVLNCLARNKTLSLEEIETFDRILVVGADPVNEAPMLALSLRQAVRKGADVLCLDPRPLDLPFDFRQIAASPREIHDILEAATSASFEDGNERLLPPIMDGDGGKWAHVQSVLNLVTGGARTAVVCGTDITDHRIIGQCAELAFRLRPRSGLCCTLPGPNAYGAALLTAPDGAVEDLLENIENGGIQALLMVETDPVWDFPDRRRLALAFSRLGFLSAMDYIPLHPANAASAFIPTQTVYESGGIFINHRGRAQHARPVFKGGMPISITGGGDHPPRTFRETVPGSDTCAAWQALDMIGGSEGVFSRQRLLAWLIDAHPELDGIQQLSGDEPLRISAKGPDMEREVRPAPESGASAGTNFEILLTEACFGTECLSHFSPPLQKLAKEPYIWMNAKQAEACGFSGYNSLWITMDSLSLKIKLRRSVKVPEGLVIMPRLSHAEMHMPDMGGRRLGRKQFRGADTRS
ncbi:MAG: NADH-quinone oxidoreductase subunit NuoG [Deltaproteobacteria bacterium]|nr:NADH-quinone oxidoreductase subunit NuoG [Deltaproteobacteria bacterium]